MNAENRPASYPLRLEPEARAKLEALAKANGRSLNTQIVMMLEELELGDLKFQDTYLSAQLEIDTAQLWVVYSI